MGQCVCPNTEDNLLSQTEATARTRCYKLNLDAPVVLSPTQHNLGPFPHEPHDPSRSDNQSKLGSRLLTLDDDISTEFNDESSIAQLNNSRIFRDADKNSTSPSRSKYLSKHRKQKCYKINKAIGIVDGKIEADRKKNNNEGSNLLSLVVIGEYNDMKHLVRDGPKQLREQECEAEEKIEDKESQTLKINPLQSIIQCLNGMDLLSQSYSGSYQQDY